MKYLVGFLMGLVTAIAAAVFAKPKYDPAGLNHPGSDRWTGGDKK